MDDLDQGESTSVTSFCLELYRLMPQLNKEPSAKVTHLAGF